MQDITITAKFRDDESIFLIGKYNASSTHEDFSIFQSDDWTFWIIPSYTELNQQSLESSKFYLK